METKAPDHRPTAQDVWLRGLLMLLFIIAFALVGRATCHSKIRVWNATAGYAFAFSFKRDSSVTALWQ
jgi:hypothetical protein